MKSKTAAKKPIRSIKNTRSSKTANTSKRFSLRNFKYLPQLVFALVFAIVGVYLLFQSSAQSPKLAVQAAPDEILVSFKPGVSKDNQDKLLARYSANVKSEIPQIQTKVIKVPAKARDAVIKALSHNKMVDFAEVNLLSEPTAVVPNDPYYSGIGSEYGFSQSDYLKGSQTNDAWDASTGSPNTIVAVLDTGYTPGLEDTGNIVPGWNVVENNDNLVAVHNHGTHVSSIVNARTNNAKGIASVCWNCSVMHVRVSTSTSGDAYTSALANGMTWAVDHGAKIINMSYGSPSDSLTLTNAVAYARSKGAVVFAAAGNNGTNVPNYPAATSGVIGVGLLMGSAFDTLANNSSYGSWVDIAAPNGYTTWPDGSYKATGGTSMASPHAAAIAGLLWSAKPAATNTQIEQAILNNTNPLLGDRQVQYGRISAYKAMQSLIGSYAITPPDTTAPTVSISSPAHLSTVAGEININVNGSDDRAVAGVRVRIKDAAYAGITGFYNEVDITAPYNFYWDSSQHADGSYTITATVTDMSGNTTNRAVTVTTKNGTTTTTDTTPPTTSISTPPSGATVTGTVNVTATASDNIGVTSSELYVDGVLRAFSSTGSVSFSWNTVQETNGSHTITIKAYDAANNVGTSNRTVTVSNQQASDTTPPSVTITSPANGAVITGKTSVRVATTDNIGVTKTELYLNGSLVATGGSSISWTWNIKGKNTSSGNYTLTAKAYDSAGNNGTQAITVMVNK